MIDLIAVARAHSASGYRVIKMASPPIDECVRLGMREGRVVDNYDESLVFYIGAKLKCGLAAGDMVNCYYNAPYIRIFKTQSRGYKLSAGSANDPKCLYLTIPFIQGKTPIRFSYRKEVAMATCFEDGVMIMVSPHHITGAQVIRGIRCAGVAGARGVSGLQGTVMKPESLDVVDDQYTLLDRIKSWFLPVTRAAKVDRSRARQPWPS